MGSPECNQFLIDPTASNMGAPLALVLTLMVGSTLAQSELKDSLKNCLGSGSNKDLNTCLRELAESLRPYMTTGLPEYNIPRTEPMYFDNVVLLIDRPPVNLTATFTKTNVRGLQQFQINSVNADLTRQTINLDMTIPKLESEGTYRMKGLAFVLEVDSMGPFEVKMQDVRVTGTTQLVNRNGRLIVVDDPTIKVVPGKLRVRFQNLFGAQGKQFAKIVHEFINEDSQTFLKDFGPQIQSQVGGMLRGLYNSAVEEIDPSVFGLN